MKEFDPHVLLLETCPAPLGEEFKIGNKGNYGKVSPFAQCSWTKEFYFQPILLEIGNVSEYSPIHALKKTFILPRWNAEDPKKRFTDLDGTKRELRVLAFYICVNRALFPPFDERIHNRKEWLELTVHRTKNIGHELLYAQQYAASFDPVTGNTARPIQMPAEEEEEKLLCPSHVIENTLENIEQTFGLQFDSEDTFKAQQSTVAVQRYYFTWLENYGVEKDVCHRRTREYLRSKVRNTDVLLDTLDKCVAQSGVGEMDPQKIKTHRDQGTPFWRNYCSELYQAGCTGHTEYEISNHLARRLASRRRR